MTVLPASASTSVYESEVASGMSVSFPSSTRAHCQVHAWPLSPFCAFVVPLASATPAVDAVSVSPTRAVPEIVGAPVAGLLGGGSHCTPASSSVLQLCTPHPACVHSASNVSPPRHCTSSSQIFAMEAFEKSEPFVAPFDCAPV